MQENHFFCAFIQKYTHAWEKEELCKIVNRVNKSSSANNLPKIELEDIVAGEGRLNKNVTRKFDDRKGIHFEENNILYGKLRPYLKKWLIPDFKGIALGDFWVLEAKDSIPIFDYFLIQSDKYQKVANNTSGTKMPRSDWKQVSTTEFYIPQNSEQTKIGNFFQVLDNLLTLHQRKCDKLKDLKKGYLQKMFPKGTEKIPEIRFINFDEEWEKKKLGKLAEIIGGGTPSTSVKEYWNGDIDWYSPIEIGKQIYVSGSRKKITELGLQKSSAKMLPIDTVLFTSRAGIGNTTILKKEGCTNQGFQSIVPKKNKLDAYFIFSRTHELKVYGETKGAGSTFIEVSGKQMTKMLLKVPKIDEQIKIGNLFQTLDQQVNQQETKLKYLKQLKQAYLQNMFV